MASQALAEQYAATGAKQRLIGKFQYASRTWSMSRVIARRAQPSTGRLGRKPSPSPITARWPRW